MTKQKYLVVSIHSWMEARGKKPQDMAKLMGYSLATWYRKMKDPGKLTMQELEMLERVTKIKILEGGKK